MSDRIDSITSWLIGSRSSMPCAMRRSATSRLTWKASDPAVTTWPSLSSDARLPNASGQSRSDLLAGLVASLASDGFGP
jgi:hypothetical protein